MNDRTLLELAARAAGIADGDVLWDMRHDKEWNPLTDDGDCARLEAACDVDVMWRNDLVISSVVDADGQILNGVEEFINHGGDKNKARRYASTRAAAQLAQAAQAAQEKV